MSEMSSSGICVNVSKCNRKNTTCKLGSYENILTDRLKIYNPYDSLYLNDHKDRLAVSCAMKPCVRIKDLVVCIIS